MFRRPDTTRSFDRLVAAVLVMAACSMASLHSAAADDAIVTGKTPIHRSATTERVQPDASRTSGGTTLVFLGGLLAAAILIRRTVQQRVRNRGRNAASEPVTLLGRQQVDGDLTVRLLQIGSRVLVVGSSPQGLATLAEITDPAEVAGLNGSVPVIDRSATPSLFSGESTIGDAPHAPPPRTTAMPRRQDAPNHRTSRVPASTRVGE